MSRSGWRELTDGPIVGVRNPWEPRSHLVMMLDDGAAIFEPSRQDDGSGDHHQSNPARNAHFDCACVLVVAARQIRPASAQLVNH